MAIFAVDVGTSGCRVGAFSNAGALIHLAEQSYDATNGPEGRVEIDPTLIERALLKCIAAAAEKAQPERILIGTFMHSLILLDEEDKPLTPLSLWSDQRARPQCIRLEQRHHLEGWRDRTGCILSPAIPLYRVLWYRENEPQILAKAKSIASIQSYLLLRLTGELIEEKSSAVSSGWRNVRTAEPDPLLVDLMGLAGVRLPLAVAATYALPMRSAVLPPGVKADVMVHAVGADGPLAHIGSAGNDPTVASLTVGTSAATRRILSPREYGSPDYPSAERASLHNPAVPQPTDNLKPESRADCWTVPLGRHMLSGIASNNGGNVLRSVAELLAPGGDLSADTLLRRAFAAQLRPGLFFRPYLFRERLLFGPQGCHWRRTDTLPVAHLDLVRAAIEAIVFHAVHLLEGLSGKKMPDGVYLSGGLATMPLVVDLFAKLIPCPVFAPDEPIPAPLRGALALALPDRFSGQPRALPPAVIPRGLFAEWGPIYREKYAQWRNWVGTDGKPQPES